MYQTPPGFLGSTAIGRFLFGGSEDQDDIKFEPTGGGSTAGKLLGAVQPGQGWFSPTQPTEEEPSEVATQDSFVFDFSDAVDPNLPPSQGVLGGTTSDSALDALLIINRFEEGETHSEQIWDDTSIVHTLGDAMLRGDASFDGYFEAMDTFIA